MTLPAMEVSFVGTGANQAYLSRAVEGRLADQWVARLLIECLANDPQGVAISQTRDNEIPSDERPSHRGFYPPADMQDIHISIGLDRGGNPSSVKGVMGFPNHEHPNRLGNLLLVAVCSHSKEEHPEVVATLSAHVAQLLRLSYTEVVVGGHGRAVRMFVNSDFPAVTSTLGYKGHSASMPCHSCLDMTCPTESHPLLDRAFETLRDWDYTHLPRTAGHWKEMHPAYGSLGRNAAELRLATHMSAERSPGIAAPPSQTVPIPLHFTYSYSLAPAAGN